MSELLTVRDVATIMKCSEDAVVRRFAKVDGVIDLGRAESKDRRQYRVLRIPKTVLEKYLSKKAGHPVLVEVPERPKRLRNPKATWEGRAMLMLASAALQNGCTDKKVFRRIADRARIMTLVPEPEWSEMATDGWFDEETEQERDY